MQLMMLNMKKSHSECVNQNEAENVAYFERELLFTKNDTRSVFRIFRREEKLHYSEKVDFRNQQLKLY